MKIARDGYPFIFTAGLFTLLALTMGWGWLGMALGIAFLAFVGFFRDPERIPPKGEGLILSPADGKIVAIKEMGKGRREAGSLEEAGTRVSIFLSPLDVHVNRAPVKGTVEGIRYQKGRFLAAYKEDASRSNEQNALRIIDPQGRKLGVVQIAGAVARRIVCYVKEGDTLEQGQRFGLIMFGSRVDLFLPAGARVEVDEGNRVYGGETIIGRFL